MNALKFSSPFKSAFCRSSRGSEAHFFQDISNDSRASLRRLLLFQHPVSAVLALLIFTTVGRADPLDTWTWRNPLPTGNYLNGITYGNDQFVAVGDLGTIVTSTDGSDWVLRESGTTDRLSDIGYGNGQFVAVGDSGTIVTSTDGVNWVQRQSGTSYPLYGIAYGNGQFVAVASAYTGAPGTIVSSADGVNWVQQQSGTAYGLNGIAYGNGQFVAVGNLGTILSSTDGTNWVQQQSGTTIGLGGIAYGNGQFVAEGGPGIILTSADGVKWAEHQPGPVGPIAYGNGQFVAVGPGGRVLESGSIITLSITPRADTGLLTLSLEGPTGLGYTVQTSTDLGSWQTLTNLTSVQPTTFIFDALPAGSDRVFYRAYSQ